MDRTPASPSLQVYTSDVLLLICTLVSLTFRACRQSGDTSTCSSPGGSGRQRRGGGDAQASAPASPFPPSGDRAANLTLLSSTSSFQSTGVEAAVGTANTPIPDESGADGFTAAVMTLLPVNGAADPLLILAERLTLEEKLSTVVNWLSLVSNCLTYFLRPSQVLYTFLFTNGDFVLFVTSYSNRYQRLHSSTRPNATSSPGVSPPSATQLTQHPHSSHFQELPSMHENWVSQPENPECEPNTNKYSVRGKHTSEEAQLHNRVEAPEVSAPQPPRSPFPAGALHGPRHRDGASLHDTGRKEASRATAAYRDNDDDSYSSHQSRYHLFRVGRPLLRFRSYVSRCVAFAQTQLSWLLMLNAVFTSTLFVFHLHHLFFGLGTLSGYLAAVASLFLCGMESGCVIVRLRREHLCGCRDGHTDMHDSDDGDDALPRLKAPDWADEAGRDPYGGIDGPRWAFVGEHLSAAACSALYVWMLIEEGDALWSSHVDLMRWYVCSCALMALSLLKCLRAVF